MNLLYKSVRWLELLNSNRNINTSTSVENIFFIYNKFSLYLRLGVEQHTVIKEEDFCLFKNFPHKYLVLPIIYVSKEIDNSNYSCTLLWLMHYKKFYEKKIKFFFEFSIFNTINFDNVNYKSKLKLYAKNISK